MAYRNLKNDGKLFENTTKDDEFYEVKYKTEKHGHESILIYLKIDND